MTADTAPLAPITSRSGPAISSTAARLATAPPSRNRIRKRPAPITFSAGRPKISRNTRLPSRCAQSACRNRALNNRCQWPCSHNAWKVLPIASPPVSAPQSSSHSRRADSGRVLAHRYAPHSSANSRGVAQRRVARWRVGMATNMGGIVRLSPRSAWWTLDQPGKMDVEEGNLPEVYLWIPHACQLVVESAGIELFRPKPRDHHVRRHDRLATWVVKGFDAPDQQDSEWQFRATRQFLERLDRPLQFHVLLEFLPLRQVRRRAPEAPVPGHQAIRHEELSLVVARIRQRLQFLVAHATCCEPIVRHRHPEFRQLALPLGRAIPEDRPISHIGGPEEALLVLGKGVDLVFEGLRFRKSRNASELDAGWHLDDAGNPRPDMAFHRTRADRTRRFFGGRSRHFRCAIFSGRTRGHIRRPVACTGGKEQCHEYPLHDLPGHPDTPPAIFEPRLLPSPATDRRAACRVAP